MLTGQAKKDYQRKYMKHKRSNKSALDLVRPTTTPFTPYSKEQQLGKTKKQVAFNKLKELYDARLPR